MQQLIQLAYNIRLDLGTGHFLLEFKLLNSNSAYSIPSSTFFVSTTYTEMDS